MVVEDIMGGGTQDAHILDIGPVLGEKTESEKTGQTLPIKPAARRRTGYGRGKGADSGSLPITGVIGVEGAETAGPDMPSTACGIPGQEKKMAV